MFIVYYKWSTSQTAAQLDLQGQTDSFIGQLPSFATASEMFKQELG